MYNQGILPDISKKWIRSGFLFVILILVFSDSCLKHMPGPLFLTVKDDVTGNIILKFPVHDGERFTIRYVHSVDHSPVFEVFSIHRKEGIVLEETYFRMFGAGMGYWEGRGKIVQDEKWIRIIDMKDVIGSFLLRVGSRGVDHTIILRNRSVNLSNIAEGRRVKIFVEK